MANILKNCKVFSINNYIITQDFNSHVNKVKTVKGAFAQGIDLVPVLPNGQYKQCDVVANCEGTVIYADIAGGYGNAVWIDHGNNIVTGYGHLANIKVRKGQKVAAGTPLGVVGSTGNSTGIHLHFECRKMVSSYIIPSASDIWNPNGFMNTAKFKWIDPTQYVEEYIIASIPSSPKPIIPNVPINDFNENTTPNRFKVKVNDIQIGAFTNYKLACKMANDKLGVVIDGVNNTQIYSAKEDYTKNIIPNRFRVKANGIQLNAYTNYLMAISFAESKNAHVYDSCNDMEMIY